MILGVGARVGSYELLAEIGRGGMGIVYRARLTEGGPDVAVKLICSGAWATPTQVLRFEREADAAAKLNHPNIVRVLEVGCHDGVPYLSMELVDGSPLSAEAARWAPQEINRRVAQNVACLARAVHYAHERGVLHRDLKPANVLIDREGQPHLTDFGLAKAIEDEGSLTRTSEQLGTPGYMAPEQARGGVSTVATDVHGLGAVFYELLTGQPPFRGHSSFQTLRQVMEENPAEPRTLRPDVDPSLSVICRRCLEKEPRHRYASAADLALDLERWLRGEAISARSVGAVSRGARWARRNPVGATLIGTLCLGLAVALGLLQQVRREKAKQTALAAELRIANQEFSQLLGRAVNMVRENLETLWANQERRSMLVSSDEIAALANRPVAPAANKSTVARYTLGLMAEELPTSRAQRHADLLAFFEERLGHALGRPARIDVRFYKFVRDCREDLCAGRIDFARLGALPYLRSRAEVPGLQPLAVPVAPPKIAVFFTRADSGIKSFSDLVGRRIAFGETNSTVSFRAQMELAQHGLSVTNLAGYEFLDASLEFAEEVRDLGFDEALKRIGYLHSHAQVIEGVLNGKFDAGMAAFRAFQINHSRGLAAIPETEFVASRPVWAGRAGLSSEVSASLRDAMLSLRGEPWLALLPDRPSSYEVVTKDTFAVEAQWLEQVLTLFPAPATSNLEARQETAGTSGAIR